jgi:CRISPR-associated protein Csd1
MLDKELNDKPYLLGRAMSMVESALGIKINERSFVSEVAEQPIKIVGKLNRALPKWPELAGILNRIGEIPERLTVEDQGQFFIGYYHQNSADWNVKNECV